MELVNPKNPQFWGLNLPKFPKESVDSKIINSRDTFIKELVVSKNQESTKELVDPKKLISERIGALRKSLILVINLKKFQKELEDSKNSQFQREPFKNFQWSLHGLRSTVSVINQQKTQEKSVDSKNPQFQREPFKNSQWSQMEWGGICREYDNEKTRVKNYKLDNG